jgi:transcriptional regulator PpsR
VEAPSAVALSDLDPQSAAAILAAAGDLALVLDETGTVRDVVFGPAEMDLPEAIGWVGKPLLELVTTDSRSKVEALLRDATARGLSRRRQVNHVGAGGDDVPIGYTAVRIGRTGHVVAVGRDMRQLSSLQTRLVEAQQAMERDYWRLRHIETRYRLLFQLAAEAILVVDASSLKVVDANTAAGALFGEATERLIGRYFPFGIDRGASERAIDELVANARTTGRGGDARVTLADGQTQVGVSASCFRQDTSTLLLVRFIPTVAGGASAMPGPQAALFALMDASPDAVILTDLDGRVQWVNRAFLDLTQLAAPDQALGVSLGEWVGRPGADLPVFVQMLKKHGAVRLVQTTARGVHGLASEVEVSAVWRGDRSDGAIGFIIRDIGRRLASGPQGARDLTRAVEQLTSLVGRTSLRELVRDTVDLVERHFIEAALELTEDNRTSAAEVLGVSRQSLYVKMRRHRLMDRPDDGTTPADG